MLYIYIGLYALRHLTTPPPSSFRLIPTLAYIALVINLNSLMSQLRIDYDISKGHTEVTLYTSVAYTTATHYAFSICIAVKSVALIGVDPSILDDDSAVDVRATATAELRLKNTRGGKPAPILGSKIGAGFRPQKSAPIFDSENRHGRKG